MATIGKYGKVVFSEEDIQFIKLNFQKMTNKNIAEALRCKKTIVRMKAYDLGLQRMKLEYWSKEAVDFLISNYQTMGNNEIARELQLRFKKQKGWTKNHILKKLKQMNLKRTFRELGAINERNRLAGSYGKPKQYGNSSPKQFYFLDNKTRVEVKEGKNIEDIKLKLEHRNDHLIKTQKN
jgi:hypothetical protein